MKAKREPISQAAVLAWLHERHPELHAKAELERSWIWLHSTDLRGESNKPLREELKAFGFRFAFRGHPLPSGKSGVWGHCCMRPMPFKRRGKSNGPVTDSTNQEPGRGTSEEDLDAAALAFINS